PGGGGMGLPRLTLLGGFDLRDGTGQKVAITTAKAALLLGYLALRAGKEIPRERLVALLWSDRGEEQARASLRQEIWTLRQAFQNAGPSPLITGRETISVNLDAIDIDTVTFENLVAKGSPDALASALALYKGDLLEGLRIRDAAFEDFLRGERQRL